MDHDSQLKHLTVLYWLDRSDHAAVVAWAEREYSTNPDPHPLLTDIFARQTDVGKLLTEIAAERLSFDPTSEDGESFARSILATQLRRFIAREISPHDVCKIICLIEGRYLGARSTGDESVYYYPMWLGDLWNACDWCDETWTHNSAGYLETEAQTVLDSLEADDGG